MEGERGAVPFIVNRTKPFVKEDRNGMTFTRIPGRFSICDCINGNNRRYPKKVWEKNLAEGSVLRQSIAKNAAFGLLEHPADGRISLQSPICILVTDAKLQTNQDESTKKPIDEVIGEIIVLETAEGQKLRALIDVGYNPLVSSRGFGSVVKMTDGVDEVQDDYVCEGWDVVLRPSFEKAELNPPRESLQAPKTEAAAPKQEAEKALAENQTPNLPQAVSSPAAPAAAPSAASDQTKMMTEHVMTINEIKSRIGAVRGTGVPKDPARFAEGMNEMAAIHQEIANFVAEDAKRGWQGQQLHEEVSRIERTWSETAQAPAKTATKLTESYTKVLKVTKALGEAALGIRKRLSEALSQNAEAAKLVEELTERGQAWVALADKRKDTIAALEHKLEVACEALDIIKTRYNEDMTEMGRHVITLEFKEKAQTPEIQKALKEATKPKDIIAIREQLDPEAAKAAKAAKQEAAKECEKCKKSPCCCEAKQEGQKAAATPAPAAQQESKKDSAPAETSPALGEARVLVPSVRSISESVAMVQRLSSADKPKEAAPAAAPAAAK